MRRLAVFLVVTGCSLFSVLPWAAAQNLKLVSEVEGISEYRLDNGIPVLLFPDQSKPKFTVNMTVLVGSRHEGYGETGMAHLLEHMLFKGTPTHQDIPKLLKDRGVLNMNGTTSLDRTNYYETLPAGDDNLEFAIRLEADRLLNSNFNSEQLASEMTVVRNEFEIGENSPISILMQRVVASAYEWHNYGKSTIGNRSDIERVPIQNLRAFYTKFYQPDNISLVVAGQFDKAKALEYLQKHFGQLQLPERKLPQTWTEEPVQDGERQVTLRRVGDVPLVAAAWHVTNAAHGDHAAMEVLAEILGMEPAGRLYQALVKSGMASSVQAMTLAGHDPGLLLCFAQLSADQNMEHVQNVFVSTIQGFDNTGVTEEEVKRAVQSLMKQREQEFADTERVAIGLTEWQASGDWRLYFLHRDRIEKVTAADVQRVAKAYLITSNRTTGQFIPTVDPVRSRIAQGPDLSGLLAEYKGRAKISEGENFEPTPANIDVRTVSGELESGVKYALLPKKTRGERVFISGKLQFGTLDSLKGNRMAASTMADLMSRGTKSRSFQQLKDRLDEVRASISLTSDPGSLNFSVQARREQLPETLDLLKEMLREPAFSADELEVIRNEQITQLESSRSEPQMVAAMALARATSKWAKEDPRYSPDLDESIQDYKSVTAEGIQELYEEFVGGQHGQIAVVGDFDSATIVSDLNEILAGWTSVQPFDRIPEPLQDVEFGKRITINTPDKANAIYIAAMPLPLRDDAADYEALVVGNYILGGGPLSSRLADRVRKKEGLSYGVGSMFRADSHDENAGLMMFAMSNPENTPKVVSTIGEEVNRLVESGVAEVELADAKSSYLETRKGSRSEDRGLAGLLRSNLELGRTMEFSAASDAKIASLTVGQVNEALKKWLDHGKSIIVTAGDFKDVPGTTTSDK